MTTATWREPDGPWQHGYFEPWTPAVGHRVRVTFSSECLWHDYAAMAGVAETTGIVVAVEPADERSTVGGHRFVVRFAEDVRLGVVPRNVGRMTALELEPLA